MPEVFDRVKVATATVGTGSLTMGAAEPRHQTFAQAGAVDGITVSYAIDDGLNWEYGTGVLSASCTVLSRTVSRSSNANAAINLSGNARVMSAVSKADFDNKTDLGHVHIIADVTGLQAALNAKEGTIAAGTTAQYWRGDKTWQTLNKAAVGLGNVDNTSDANKPVSTAQQTALDGKLSLGGGQMTGRLGLSASGLRIATKDDITTRTDSGFFNTGSATTAEGWPTTTSGWYHLISATHENDTNYYAMQFAGQFDNQNEIYYRTTANNGAAGWNKLYHSGNLSKSTLGLGNVDNTSDANKPVSTAQQTALNAKANLSGATFTGAVNSTGGEHSGQVSFTGVTGNNNINNSNGGLGAAEVRGNGTGGAFMQFHRPSSFAAYFGLGTDNKWRVGGWSMGAVSYELFHEGHAPTKGEVGLGNVDNTSDANKPVSTATQNALNNKVDKVSGSRPGVTKLYRRENDSGFSVQNHWTGSYWQLRGYNADDSFHAECYVERSGSAGYADSAGRAYPRRSDGGDLNFYWSGQGGQPTWLWGGGDGANMYVYNPSNFSVNYANSANALANSPGGAPHYACRAWVRFNGTGTVAITGAGNVSSIGDVGNGNYQVNFSTAMPDTLGAVQVTGSYYNGTQQGFSADWNSASQVAVRTLAGNTGQLLDFTSVYVSVFR